MRKKSIGIGLIWGMLLIGHFQHALAQVGTDEIPFQLSVDVEPRDNADEVNLILDLELREGDWVVSSMSTDSMFGKVQLRFSDPDAVALMGPMQESPDSQWEIERFSQLKVKVIHERTRMVQPIRFSAALEPQEAIVGEVFFVVEPLCMPFETTFALVPPSAEQPNWEVLPFGSRLAMPSGR